MPNLYDLPRETRDKLAEISKFIQTLFDMEEDELDEIDEQFSDDCELHAALTDECKTRYNQMVSREQRRYESLFYPQITNKWMCGQFLPSMQNGKKLSRKQYDVFCGYGVTDRYNRVCLTAANKIYRVSSYDFTLEVVEI